MKLKHLFVAIMMLGLGSLSNIISAEEPNLEESEQQRGSWYLYGDFGYAPGSASLSSLNQQVLDNNLLGSVTSIDDSRTGYDFGLGYQLTSIIGIELGYLDLGEVVLNATANQSNLVEFFDVVEAIHPESGEGLTLAAVANIELAKDWKATGKLGYFDWDGKYNTFNQGQGVGNDSGKDASLFYGLGINYQLDYNWDLGAQWRRFEFDNESTSFWSLGFRWYPFAEEKSVKVVAPQPIIAKVVPPQAEPVIVDADKDGVNDEVDNCLGTKLGAKVNSDGCILLKKVTLKVEFASSSAEVLPNYLSKIEELANYLKQQSKATVAIHGHTDSSGSEKFNSKLSKARAKSVAGLLVTKYGIAAERVTSEGFGESQPITSNNSAAGKALNRRVIAVIQDK